MPCQAIKVFWVLRERGCCLLESAAWLGIDGSVNCFVADKARTDGFRHLAEFGGNLLR